MKLETAETQYVSARGTEYSYRRIGDQKGVPLVLMQHFSGTMDGWDPLVVNGLAEGRQVLVFNNAGVGSSGGATPDNVAQMARDAADFVAALGLAEVDILGYSLGGMVAQQFATVHPDWVRKLILVGTAPRGGTEHLLKVLGEARGRNDSPDPRLYLFFTQSTESRAAGQAFLDRTRTRQSGRDPDSGESVMNPQARAIITWCAAQDPGDSILGAIRQPALIVNGSNDIMLPAENSWHMFNHMRNAQLILYPDSGHGSLFQYPELFVRHATVFLDA